MLKEHGLFGTTDKVKDSIKLLQKHEPEEGYYLAFSGGKDSVVIKHLALLAGVRFSAAYSNTTIDPPELVRYIRSDHPDVSFVNPIKPFVMMLKEKGFPQRQRRWCCEHYKEIGGDDMYVITGIRAAESARRAKRKQVEPDSLGRKKGFVHPIMHWSDDDVWEFISEYGLSYCSLYDEGWERIGCLMCPFAKQSSRLYEAERYPGYRKLFIWAFNELYKLRKSQGKTSVDRWPNGEAMFWWWLGRDYSTEDSDQLYFFEKDDD